MKNNHQEGLNMETKVQMPKEMQTLKPTLAPSINIFHTKDSRETCIYNRPNMNIEEKSSM